jgi:hypothetical protein
MIEPKSDNASKNDRPQYFEELRFAKKQQWSVATAAISLIAAIYAVEHGETPSPNEKILTAILITLIAVFGCFFLVNLQQHMRATRLTLNEEDKDPLLRGVSVLAVLMGAIISSAAFVIYFLIVRKL